MARSLPITFAFSPEEREALQAPLLALRSSPYLDYASFQGELADLLGVVSLPAELRAACDEVRTRKRPILALRNVPNDIERPIFDGVDPVGAKRRLKKTFVAEAMLEIAARLSGMQTLTYKNDNDGDFFHDVYPVETEREKQSQKSLVSLGFHNDGTNHFARPDRLQLMCMRNPAVNRVLTTFAVGAECVAGLDAETREVLRRPTYLTPEDDLTAPISGLPPPPPHAVLGEDGWLSYFEGRTRGASPVEEGALAKLREQVHATAYAHLYEPDDLVSIDNHRVLHGRSADAVVDVDAHKTRWMVKSYATPSLEKFARFYVPGRRGVVDG